MVIQTVSITIELRYQLSLCLMLIRQKIGTDILIDNRPLIIALSPLYSVHFCPVDLILTILLRLLNLGNSCHIIIVHPHLLHRFFCPGSRTHYLLLNPSVCHGLIASLPPIYILSGFGILTEPSSLRLFSKNAISIRGGATTVLLSVCAK